jgi:hypothetical protein
VSVQSTESQIRMLGVQLPTIFMARAHAYLPGPTEHGKTGSQAFLFSANEHAKQTLQEPLSAHTKDSARPAVHGLNTMTDARLTDPNPRVVMSMMGHQVVAPDGRSRDAGT